MQRTPHILASCNPVDHESHSGGLAFDPCRVGHDSKSSRFNLCHGDGVYNCMDRSEIWQVERQWRPAVQVLPKNALALKNTASQRSMPGCACQQDCHSAVSANSKAKVVRGFSAPDENATWQRCPVSATN